MSFLRELLYKVWRRSCKQVPVAFQRLYTCAFGLIKQLKYTSFNDRRNFTRPSWRINPKEFYYFGILELTTKNGQLKDVTALD